MSNNKLNRLLEDSRFLKVVSVFLAIMMWGYVVVFVNNEHTTTIHDVPINMQYRAASRNRRRIHPSTSAMRRITSLSPSTPSALTAPRLSPLLTLRKVHT